MTPIWVNITLSRTELLATEVKAAYHNRLTIKSGMSQAHNARWENSDFDSEQTLARSSVFVHVREDNYCLSASSSDKSSHDCLVEATCESSDHIHRRAALVDSGS